MKSSSPAPEALLFSIDLEPFYPADSRRDPRSSPLPELVSQYLALLRQHRVRATFFVVGEVARQYPAMLQAIAADGHELGCHGDHHRTLDQFTPASFAVDVRANRAAVEAASGVRVQGFRAPLLSVTPDTRWAHAVLAAEGFTYSSSVLPAPNPLFGWPDFGAAPRQVDGIVEIPVTLARVPGLGALPVYCGTYFRILPWFLTGRSLPAQAPSLPLVSYFHPYDIDHRQPWAMHAGVRGSRAMNLLLFLRRASLLKRIARLLQACPSTSTYGEYVAHWANRPDQNSS